MCIVCGQAWHPLEGAEKDCTEEEEGITLPLPLPPMPPISPTPSSFPWRTTSKLDIRTFLRERRSPSLRGEHCPRDKYKVGADTGRDGRRPAESLQREHCEAFDRQWSLQGVLPDALKFTKLNLSWLCKDQGGSVSPWSWIWIWFWRTKILLYHLI